MSKPKQLNSLQKINSSPLISQARMAEEDGCNSTKKKQKRNIDGVDDRRDLDKRDSKCARSGNQCGVSPSSFAIKSSSSSSSSSNSSNNPSSKLTPAQRFKERKANRLKDLENKLKEFFDDNVKLREEAKKSSEKLKKLSDVAENVGVAIYRGKLTFQPKSQDDKEHLCELVTNIATLIKCRSATVAHELLHGITDKIKFSSVTEAKNNTTAPVTRHVNIGTAQQYVYHTTDKDSAVNMPFHDSPSQQLACRSLAQIQPNRPPNMFYDSTIHPSSNAHNTAVGNSPTAYQPPNYHGQLKNSVQSDSTSFIATGGNTAVPILHCNTIAASAQQQNFGNSWAPQRNALITAPAYTDTNQGGGNIILNNDVQLLMASLFGQNNVLEKYQELVLGNQR